MLLIGFQASKIWIFFGTFFAEQVLKSFSDRNNSLEPLVFEISNSLTYGLDESRKFETLISWVLAK